MPNFASVIARLSPDAPVLIAGPTASGKSALALAIAEAQGGVIVNADALQVFAGWRLLTARPDAADLARAPHVLYGHVAPDRPYSVGDWLRDLAPRLAGPERLILVGGTGLYFAALTEGLAAIPPTPPEVRAEAGARALPDLIADLDPVTRAALDLHNRARVQRAWEVWRATGRPITDWQAETPPPLLPLAQAQALILRPDIPWLEGRIARRAEAMLAGGVLDEARALKPGWRADHPASKAIGATELMAHLDGRLPFAELLAALILQTRQYAKRQRTWGRSRRDWTALALP